jgi:hypothetical protein
LWYNKFGKMALRVGGATPGTKAVARVLGMVGFTTMANSCMLSTGVYKKKK